MSKRRELVKADIKRRRVVELMSSGKKPSQIVKITGLSYKYVKMIVDQEAPNIEVKASTGD